MQIMKLTDRSLTLFTEPAVFWLILLNIGVSERFFTLEVRKLNLEDKKTIESSLLYLSK